VIGIEFKDATQVIDRPLGKAIFKEDLGFVEQLLNPLLDLWPAQLLHFFELFDSSSGTASGLLAPPSLLSQGGRRKQSARLLGQVDGQVLQGHLVLGSISKIASKQQTSSPCFRAHEQERDLLVDRDGFVRLIEPLNDRASSSSVLRSRGLRTKHAWSLARACLYCSRSMYIPAISQARSTRAESW